LLPEARATLAAASAAREAVEQVLGGLRGTVTLGMMQADVLGPIDVIELLVEFRARHPLVELRVKQGHAMTMAEQVRDGQLDLAFIAWPTRRANGLTLTPVTSEVFGLGVPDAHPLAGRADIELAAVANETFADGPPTWGTRVATDRAFAAAGAHRHVSLEVNDMKTMVELVRHGLAVCFMAESFMRDPTGITLIPVRHHAPIFARHIAEPANRRQSAAAAALLAMAKERYNAATASR
jgi:DNA-binding transcriptional LysR family regulator